MARALQFEVDGESLAVAIEKVDRRKIYGWVDGKAFDRDNLPCYMGSLSGGGLYLFGREAFEQGYLNQAGEWVERNELLTVDAEGAKLNAVDSSFKSSISLADEVSIDDYLPYNTKLAYQLSADTAAAPSDKVGERIFQFTFNYTTSYEPDHAFLLNNGEGLFMVIGQRAEYAFIGKEEESDLSAADEEDADEEEAGDIMDFSMM